VDKTCHECNEIGHIKPNCPLLKKKTKGDKNGDEDETQNETENQVAKKEERQKKESEILHAENGRRERDR
jgi:hypothetical protein